MNKKQMVFLLVIMMTMSFFIGMTVSFVINPNTSDEVQDPVAGKTTYQKIYQDDVFWPSRVPQNLPRYFPPEEISTIANAGRRNNLNFEQIVILFAIRKAENGGTNFEFGIINPKANTFELQAGWCAATIYKNQKRWEQAGKSGDFITFLGGRYCPTTGDLSENEKKLNKHWIPNVKYWIRKIKG